MSSSWCEHASPGRRRAPSLRLIPGRCHCLPGPECSVASTVLFSRGRGASRRARRPEHPHAGQPFRDRNVVGSRTVTSVMAAAARDCRPGPGASSYVNAHPSKNHSVSSAFSVRSRQPPTPIMSLNSFQAVERFVRCVSTRDLPIGDVAFERPPSEPWGTALGRSVVGTTAW